MNRRQKIIVSVTGIFIVLLILIGLTYAYFLTRITGNGNPTSISVTTANLELVYGDGTTAILTSSNPLMPSSTPIGTKDFTVTNNGDDSEYVVVFEDVTVKYAADTVINGQAVTAGTDTTFESNDFVYTLTCEVKDKNGNTLSDKSCDGVENGSFPMDGGIVVGNSIDKDDVHNYELTLYYLDNGFDQSADMNKALNGKVNIKDIKSINPYSENTSSLAYNIINNSVLNKNGTQLVATPPSKVAEETSLVTFTGEYKVQEIPSALMPFGYNPWTVAKTEDGAISGSGVSTCADILSKGGYVYDQSYSITNFISPPIVYVEGCSDKGIPIANVQTVKYEQVLSVTTDDYGTSYYYRGNVEDNYVNFAGMCWKIVRIAGDGSIKLILDDKNTTCDDDEDNDGNATADYKYTGDWNIGQGYYGRTIKDIDNDSVDEYVMDYLKPSYSGSSSMVKAFYDFQTTSKLKNYTGKLKSGDWCLGDKAYKQSGTSGSYIYTPLEEYDYSGEMYYDSYVRLRGDSEKGYQPSLKCNGNVLNSFANFKIEDTTITTELPMYVATLTADEVAYAGGIYGGTNKNYYLINRERINYGDIWWLLSPSIFSGTDYAFISDQGSFGSDQYQYNLDLMFRPSIFLKSNTIVVAGGDGTQSNPYVVE